MRRCVLAAATSGSARAALACAAAVLLAAGCGEVYIDLPPVGVPQPLAYVVQEKPTGPVTVIFPGRSAPTDDVTLGIRQTALAVAERAGGSVGLFSWKVYDAAKRWTAREAALRRKSNERVRLALVGHSWGGQAASRFARETLAEGIVDEVSVLVTLDAIKKGYVKSFFNWWGCLFTFDLWPAMAFRDSPAPDRRKILRHVNYYQLDSFACHGAVMPTADENHEVWFDTGSVLGHGNLDNFLIDIVAEDVRRAFLTKGE